VNLAQPRQGYKEVFSEKIRWVEWPLAQSVAAKNGQRSEMSVLCDSGKRFSNVRKHPRWSQKCYLKAGSEAA
jgi:hypothetical protein